MADDNNRVVDLLQKILRVKGCDRWVIQAACSILVNQYDEVVGNHTPARRVVLERVVREIFPLPEPLPEPLPGLVPYDEWDHLGLMQLRLDGLSPFPGNIPPETTLTVIGTLGDDDVDCNIPPAIQIIGPADDADVDHISNNK